MWRRLGAEVVDAAQTLAAFMREETGGRARRGWRSVAVLRRPPSLDDGAVTVIIGPEGGLTSSERETAVAAGYRS